MRVDHRSQRTDAVDEHDGNERRHRQLLLPEPRERQPQLASSFDRANSPGWRGREWWLQCHVASAT